MARLIEVVPEAQFPFLRQQVLRSSQTEVTALALSLKHAHMHSAQPPTLSLIGIVSLYHVSPVLIGICTALFLAAQGTVPTCWSFMCTTFCGHSSHPLLWLCNAHSRHSRTHCWGCTLLLLLVFGAHIQTPLTLQWVPQKFTAGTLQGACSRDDFKEQITAELDHTCASWSAWAVALRWINMAAAICEGNKPSTPPKPFSQHLGVWQGGSGEGVLGARVTAANTSAVYLCVFHSVSLCGWVHVSRHMVCITADSAHKLHLRPCLRGQHQHSPYMCLRPCFLGSGLRGMCRPTTTCLQTVCCPVRSQQCMHWLQ